MKSKAGHNSIGSEVRKHAAVADGDGAGGSVHLTSAFSLEHVFHLSSGVVHTQVP